MEVKPVFHFVQSPKFKGRWLKESQTAICGRQFSIFNGEDPTSCKRQFAVLDSRSMAGHNEVNCDDCLTIQKFKLSKGGFEEFLEMHKALNPSVDFNDKKDLMNFVKGILPVYHSFKNNQNGYCDICGERLSMNDVMVMSPYDSIYTCSFHKEYAMVFQPNIIRQALAIKDEEITKKEDFFG